MTPQELKRISEIISSYHLLPFSGGRVPGDVLEGVLANTRGARVLGKYDFVDIVDEKARVGWQVKSTAEGTPVTWKRAKIADRNLLIAASENDAEGVKRLGRALIDFCNAAVAKSFADYAIDSIGYARLVVHAGGSATYFERELVTRASPVLFHPEEFDWRWTKERVGGKKEQLSAFHGVHRPSGAKWWAWHGRGENQLHFAGERTWWPAADGANAITFRLPTRRFSMDEFLEVVDVVNERRQRRD